MTGVLGVAHQIKTHCAMENGSLSLDPHQSMLQHISLYPDGMAWRGYRFILPFIITPNGLDLIRGSWYTCDFPICQACYM